MCVFTFKRFFSGVNLIGAYEVKLRLGVWHKISMLWLADSSWGALSIMDGEQCVCVLLSWLPVNKYEGFVTLA